MKRKFKKGQLVYTKDVGYPYNRTDNGAESWEGVSCIVIEPVVNKNYVRVEAIFPVKTVSGIMTDCVFYPNSLRHENRPWLKRHLQKIIKFRKTVENAQKIFKEILE
jgi:hypothetical protein